MHKNVSSVTKCLVKYNTLYFKFDWKQNETDLFHINIYYDNKSWSGRFSNEFAARYMQTLKENEDVYYKTVKDVLLGESDSFTFDFSYLPTDPKVAKFSWRKVSENSKIIVEHGSVPMHEDEVAESKDMLVDFLLLENNKLKLNIQEYEFKNEMLSKDLNDCKSQLERFIEMKTSLENTLYGKFGQILNSKKRRIRTLEQRLELIEIQNRENDVD